MSHPFFDAVTFPWDNELGIKFHWCLYTAIDSPEEIEMRCQQCLSEILLNKNGDAKSIWREALKKLTTASLLRQLCENLLSDRMVTSIHPTLLMVMNGSNAFDPVETRGITEGEMAFDESDGIEQLIKIATELLEDCKEAKDSIVQFNGHLDPPLASDKLARIMLESESPMSYLFNCAYRKYTFEAARESHYKKCMWSLACTEPFQASITPYFR